MDTKTISLFSAERGTGDSVVSARGRILAALVMHACEGRVTTYGELAPIVGLPAKGNHMGVVLGNILGDIFRFCVEKDLPHITSIVVYKSGGDKGIPGGLFWTLYDDWLLNVEQLANLSYSNAKKADKRAVVERLQEEVFLFFRSLA